MEFRNDPLYKLAKGEKIIEDGTEKQINKRWKQWLKDHPNASDADKQQAKGEFEYQLRLAKNNGDVQKTEKEVELRHKASDLGQDRAQAKKNVANDEEKHKKATDNVADKVKNRKGMEDEYNQSVENNDDEDTQEFKKAKAEQANKEESEAKEQAALAKQGLQASQDQLHSTDQALKDVQAELHSPDEEVEAEIEKEETPQENDKPQVGDNKPTDSKPEGDNKPAEDPKPQSNAQAGSVESIIQQISNLKDYAGFERIVGKLMDEMKACVSKYELGSEENTQTNPQNQPTDNPQPTQE